MLKLPGLVAALLLAGPAWADKIDRIIDPAGHFEYQDDSKPWQELKAVLPAFPAEGDWVELDLGGDAGGYRYYLDPSELDVGNDGVVRYAAAMSSEDGVRNVFYEGLRCSDRKYKIYAYGGEHRWQPMERPAWKAVELVEQGPYRFRRVLHTHYLCDAYWHVLPRNEILSRIRGRASDQGPGL